MLAEVKKLNKRSEWRRVKDALYKDKRYRAVSGSEKREALFKEYVSKLAGVIVALSRWRLFNVAYPLGPCNTSIALSFVGLIICIKSHIFLLYPVKEPRFFRSPRCTCYGHRDPSCILIELEQFDKATRTIYTIMVLKSPV